MARVVIAVAACVGWLVFGVQYGYSDWSVVRLVALILFAGSLVYWMRASMRGLFEPLTVHATAIFPEAHLLGDVSSPSPIVPSHSMMQMVWLCDADGDLESLNGQRCKHGESLVSETAHFVLPEDLETFRQEWQRSLDHSSAMRCELRVGSTPESCCWHLAQAQAVCDNHGRIVQWCGTFTNIDEYKRAQLKAESEACRLENLLTVERQRADAADQAKKTFLAATSHEIRTIMHALLGMADMLWESELSDDQRHYVEVFRQAGGSLFELLNNTLDVSKPQSADFTAMATAVNPAARPPVITPVIPPAKKIAKTENRVRILVAEDSEDNRFLLQAYCHGTAYELTFVEDGALAVAAYQADSFELLVMDVQMPVMDGLAATREIRNIEAGRGAKRTPILALTANVLPQDVTRAREAGCDAHLAKPISKKSFLAGIEQWLAASIAA